MPYKPGESGNPKGWPKGKKQARAARVRALINDKTGVIVEKILANAENGDVASMQMFCKHLMPRHRFVPEPVDLPPAADLVEIRAQIAKLASLAASGELDLDSMTQIARTLALAAGLRLEELEDILAEKEGAESDHDDQR